MAESKRRGRGEGALFWDEAKERWVANVTVGYTAAGKRIRRKASGKTKTEARANLRSLLRDYEDGLAIAHNTYTVAQAVEDFLGFAFGNKAQATRDKAEYLARGHVIPDLGA